MLVFLESETATGIDLALVQAPETQAVDQLAEYYPAFKAYLAVQGNALPG